MIKNERLIIKIHEQNISKIFLVHRVAAKTNKVLEQKKQDNRILRVSRTGTLDPNEKTNNNEQGPSIKTS